MSQRIDGNGLRSPTLKEMASLPTSIDEAKKQGLNVYLNNKGQAIKIRFKTRIKKPDQFGLKAEYEPLESWRGRNALQPGKRLENERLSTPEGADKQAFNKAVTDARLQGKQGDHRYSVARTGNALKEMSLERQQLMHKRFQEAGIALGNQAQNIDPLDSYTNKVVKPAQERAVDTAIKNAKGSLNPIDLIRQQIRFLESNPMARRSLAMLAVVGLAASGEDAMARQQKAEQTGNILDQAQAGLAAVGMDFEPADWANTAIDLVRAKGAFNVIRGRSGAMRAARP